MSGDVSAAARILVVEDERAIADAVAYRLQLEGYAVDVEADGAAALQAARAGDYDLVVLDLTLPGLPGLEVCRRLRRGSIVPILILTARSAVSDRVLGLEAGADDYLPKPFANAELIGRIRAILRRRELERSAGSSERTVGDLRLDLVGQGVRVAGRAVELTQSEFRLLALLARSPERAFTRREIVEHLWRSSFVGDERTCDVHVKNLRRKIERDPSRPRRIVTVRGVGYMLRA